MLIAMLNVRFTCTRPRRRGAEIGTLKAIGLRDRDIKRLYRAKYAAISGLACLLGAVAAFPLTHLFTGNIALNFGLAPPSALSYGLPFLAAGLVFLLTLWILGNILKLLSRLTILEALQDGTLASARRKRKRRAPDRLGHALTPATGNVVNRLSLLGLSRDFKSWSLLLAVFLLTSFAIVLPLNLQTTLDARVRALHGRAGGGPHAQHLAAGTDDNTADIAETLAADPAIARFAASITHVVDVEGKKARRRFTSTRGLRRLPDRGAGRPPAANSDEIALSAFNAERLQRLSAIA